MTPQHKAALDRQLLTHEGLKLKPYRDTLGHLTIGIGHLLSKGISRRAAQLIYEDDLLEATIFLHTAYPWTVGWITSDPVRYRVLVDMAFNLGSRLAEFKATLRAAKAKDWEAMAAGMENSLWYEQTGRRAATLVTMIRTGQDPFSQDT